MEQLLSTVIHHRRTGGSFDEREGGGGLLGVRAGVAADNGEGRLWSGCGCEALLAGTCCGAFGVSHRSALDGRADASSRSVRTCNDSTS